MQEEVILPKVYDDPFGNYPQHVGKPKISYSQYNSFVSSDYRGKYFGQYFLGVPDEGNIFSDFGGKCGEWWEKLEYYASDDYQQTTLYSYQRIQEGYTINYSGVKLLERKGNGSEKYPLKLSGKIKEIPTPYSEERAEKFLSKMDVTVREISKYYQMYLTLFKN